MEPQGVTADFISQISSKAPTFYALTEPNKGLAIRLAMLMTQYRKPIDWTHNRIEEAAKILNKWQKIAAPGEAELDMDLMMAMLDDMNTPKAIAALNKLAKDKKGAELYVAMKLLGFIPED